MKFTPKLPTKVIRTVSILSKFNAIPVANGGEGRKRFLTQDADDNHKEKAQSKNAGICFIVVLLKCTIRYHDRVLIS